MLEIQHLKSVILSIIIGIVLLATVYELSLLAVEYLEKNRNYLRSNSFFLKYLIRRQFQSQLETRATPIAAPSNSLYLLLLL